MLINQNLKGKTNMYNRVKQIWEEFEKQTENLAEYEIEYLQDKMKQKLKQIDGENKEYDEAYRQALSHFHAGDLTINEFESRVDWLKEDYLGE